MNRKGPRIPWPECIGYFLIVIVVLGVAAYLAFGL